MRLWSVHPQFLDRQGFLGTWREALLAQKVLAGLTRGYTRHPQLERFRAQTDPLASIGVYLSALAEEADARGYRFDRSRIMQPADAVTPMEVTRGQLEYEWAHLLVKVQTRDIDHFEKIRDCEPLPHPLFTVVAGPMATWERPSSSTT
ncbi:MAG: pyrimidine dimer DNA glycosylase/endonuclease V [Actinomycetaceae bacterium]|nr:pyrimidine dimer DNA glycosylase/endonuclease V [Actinomycetaceae bacterium]